MAAATPASGCSATLIRASLKDLFFYTKQQLRELQDDAKARGITVTPEIDMPGHARVFTNYWPDLQNSKLSKSYLDGDLTHAN